MNNESCKHRHYSVRLGSGKWMYHKCVDCGHSWPVSAY